MKLRDFTLTPDSSYTTLLYNVSYTNAFSPAKQITAADISNSAFVYQQSANGTTNYDTNGLNQYTAVGGQGVGYDPNGNLTSDGTFSFGYDIENRLTGASSASLSATYAYDPLGRRTQKIANGATTIYLNSGDDEIAEYSDASANTLTRRYIPGPAIDRPVAMVDYTSGSEALRFFYIDRQGSVVAMSDSAGNPTEGPYTYSEFGECQSGGQLCSGGVPYKYTGRRYDAETGLYYYRARYYSAKLGRFLQTDPIGYKDDLNWYAYVGNDPTNKVDPDGREIVLLTPQGSGAYGASVSYMSKSSAFRGIYNGVKNAKGIVYVVVNPHFAGGANFDSRNNTITYNPNLGLKLESGAVDSAALGLGHEFDHALHKLENPAQYEHDRNTSSAPQITFDPKNHMETVTQGASVEEAKATNAENAMASQLGESQRKDHDDGKYVPVPDPTYHKKPEQR